jgi:hypothetical protein
MAGAASDRRGPADLSGKAAGRVLNLRNLFALASFGANWRLSLTDGDKRKLLASAVFSQDQSDAEAQFRT